MARSCEDLRSDQGESDINPFLFSNFLKKESSGDDTAQVWRNFDSTESVDHAPFPNLFAQPTSNKEASKKKTRLKNERSKAVHEDKHETRRRVLKIVDDEIHTIDEREIEQLLEVKSKRKENGMKDDELPNSSSDMEENQNTDSDDSSPLESSYILPTSVDAERTKDLIESTLEELEAENASLRQRVKQLENDISSEKETSKKRIENLVDELQAVKKKELEETAALENIVQMVEENLRQTTQRALKAEAAVSKMKDEVKFFKEQQIPRSQHRQMVEEHELTLESIRQKSKAASKFMHTTADRTEPLLKQLLSGVSSLRLFAEQFEDIDRISEVDPTRDRVV